MAFDISQLFGQGTINRLMTSQLTGPQSTFTNQSAVQNVTSPQPTPAPLMQNVPGSLSAGLGGPQSSDPWSGMRQASTPSQQAFPDDLGDKLARGLHNFASSSTGQWLNNMFAGWAQGSSPQDSIARGGMSVANGTTRNHTVDLLVKNGFDPQSAQAIAGNPAALNEALKTVMDRQNPDHQLQVQKTQAEISRINAEGQYYGNKGNERFVNTGGGFMFDRQAGQYISHPDAGKTPATAGGDAIDPDDFPVVPLNDQGIPDEQAQHAFLAKLPPDQASLVKGISEGRIDIGKVTSLKAGERQKMTGLVSLYDPTFDMTKAAARATTAKDYASGGKADVMKSSTNMAIQHAALMYDHAVKLHNSAYPMYNWAANTIRDNLGNKELQDNLSGFMSGRSGFGTEVAKSFHGAGAVPEAQVEEWKNQLSPNNPPNKIRETVEAAMHMLAARTESYNTSYKNNMGRNAPDFLTPNSIAALKRMGISTNVLGIPDPQGGGAGRSPSVVHNSDGSVTIDGYKITALKG